jgi:GT2 family glycosyltransferase
MLMRRALAEHPVERLPGARVSGEPVDITFLIGHRGRSRLPHLLATLESIAGQQGVNFECIVVEQDETPVVLADLPKWVRHLHTPPPAAGMPYCRAWTFNTGARHARGRVLILHDNDMLVPTDYAQEVIRRVDQGSEVVNLKRFIFYLGEDHTQKVFARTAALDAYAPATIVQNLEAGGSVAITAEAYRRIGGVDEGFVGWGGEDNEFWERAQTLRVWPYGYLPLVHLWHAPQPEKLQKAPVTLEYFRSRSSLPVSQRIAELTARDAGNPHHLDPRWPVLEPRA